jgi:hypothetical protein
MGERQLVYALIVYLIGLIAAITLMPFFFIPPERVQISTSGSIIDIIQNIVLFPPLGFIFGIISRRDGVRAVVKPSASEFC